MASFFLVHSINVLPPIAPFGVGPWASQWGQDAALWPRPFSDTKNSLRPAFNELKKSHQAKRTNSTKSKRRCIHAAKAFRGSIKPRRGLFPAWWWHRPWCGRARQFSFVRQSSQVKRKPGFFKRFQAYRSLPVGHQAFVVRSWPFLALAPTLRRFRHETAESIQAAQ